MKKSIAFISLVLGFSTLVSSQGIYFRVGTGYGLPAATATIGENYYRSYDYNGGNIVDESSNESVSASFGSGLNFNFAVGYKFHENLMVDVNMYYLSGNNVETSYIYEYTDGQYSTTDRSLYESKSSAFYFNPSVIFSAGFGKGAPYGRFGVVAASPKITENENYYSDGDGVNEGDVTWEYRKGMGIGYQAAVGMNWKLNDKFDIYGEVNFVSMTYYAKEGEMTKNIQNGTNILDQLTTYDKNIEFLKAYDPNTPYDPAKPQVSGRSASPFSAVSAQVGLRFSILSFGE